MKICIECGEEKELSEFYNRKDSGDGKYPKCKSCHIIVTRKWNVNNREKVREYGRKHKYTRSPSDTRKYRLANPEKKRAQQAVNVAVKYGRMPHISTRTCDTCGKPAQDYHHPSYLNELDVIPLCRICHSFLHRQQAQA